MDNSRKLASSFRDPSGFVFIQDRQIFRRVNLSYKPQYDHLMASGLYDALVKQKLMVSHEEFDHDSVAQGSAYKIIRPEQIPYVSYPYEWSFSQLKDAALCTMEIQKIAFRHGMVLKDASAYNVQFLHGKPVFIDTLSFEVYEEGKPWLAYRQFCQHFIAPLALMAFTDARLSQLFRIYMDGIPLDLASQLLPLTTWFRYSLLVHIHLHARSQKHYANAAVESGKDLKATNISKAAFAALMESIVNGARRIEWRLSTTEWGNYYSATNYQDAAMLHKESLVAQFLENIPEKTCLLHDLGANNGHFSRIAEKKGYVVVAQDIDPVAVEKNYRYGKQVGETNILPLVQDLTNPSGGIGWALQERESFMQRCHDETVLALALVHHLAISNNVPLEELAKFFANVARFLIIEFVPKEDSQVKRLLATREDIFTDYNIDGFEKAFSAHFGIVSRENIRESSRILFLMEKAV